MGPGGCLEEWPCSSPTRHWQTHKNAGLHIESSVTLYSARVQTWTQICKASYPLQQNKHLGERWTVCHQEVHVGGVQPWLAVQLASSSVPHVVHQGLHELVLCG
jgi:hypothetical protein